jgi:hypothetical protein
MWRSVYLYSKFFQSYWRFPLTISASERRVKYTTTNRDATIWKIGITYLFGFFNILIHLFAVFAYISVGDPATAFLCVLDVTITAMNIIFGYLVLGHGGLASSTMNHLFILEELMKTLQGKKERRSSRDRIGAASVAMTVILGCLPYLATLSVPLIDIPFLSAQKNVIFKTIEFLSRKMCIFILLNEFCRTICGMLLAIIICVKIVQQISVDLKSIVQKMYFRFGQYLNVYNGMIITLQQCIALIGPAIAFLMVTGLGICVFSNFVTLKFRTDAIPFPFFYIFPGLAVFTPAMINIVLPEGILCHELTNELIVKWRNSVYSVWSTKANRKYIVRRLKALRTLDCPVGIAGCNFFYIVRDTKVAFYTNIMDNTVNAVLSFPDVH